jgi:hypothetical protein
MPIESGEIVRGFSESALHSLFHLELLEVHVAVGVGVQLAEYVGLVNAGGGRRRLLRHAHDLDVKVEGRASRDLHVVAARLGGVAVRHGRGYRQPALLALAHPEQPLLPSLDGLVAADLEGERRLPRRIQTAVEHGTVLVLQVTSVVHLHVRVDERARRFTAALGLKVRVDLQVAGGVNSGAQHCGA